MCGRGTPFLWKCFCMLCIFLENYVYTLRDTTVEREVNCLWSCNINSFIHSCTHSTNLYLGRGVCCSHTKHIMNSPLSRLTLNSSKRCFSMSRFHKACFVSHTNNSNKNNPCHLYHQKKKKRRYTLVHRSKQVILVTL